MKGSFKTAFIAAVGLSRRFRECGGGDDQQFHPWIGDGQRA